MGGLAEGLREDFSDRHTLEIGRGGMAVVYLVCDPNPSFQKLMEGPA